MYIFAQSDVDEEATIPITPEPRRLNQLEQYLTSPSSPEAENEPEEDQTLMTNGFGFSIIEESEDEDSTSSTIQSVESEQEHSAIITEQQPPSPMPLRDLTNTTSRIISSPKIKKWSGKSTSAIQNDTESDIQETAIGNVRRGAQKGSPARQKLSQSSPKKRTIRRKAVIVDNEIDCENLESSIQQVRHAIRQSSPLQLTFSGNSVNAGPDYSPRCSQLNFDRFNGIICRPGNCSTPRQEQDTLPSGWKRSKCTVNNAPESEGYSSNESTLTCRPSRSCRPKSLKEPNLVKKLRNESTTKQ